MHAHCVNCEKSTVMNIATSQNCGHKLMKGCYRVL